MHNPRSLVASLNSLVLFEAAARLMNFSRAAEELSLTPSAVSHGIKQLEASLGVPLFLREPRALALTPEGERLYRCVGVSLAAIAETIETIADRSAGRSDLVIAVSTSMAAHWLLPRLSSFRRAFPSVRLRIETVDRDLDLVGEGIDLAIRLGDGKWPAYDTIVLWPEEIRAVCSPGYLAAAPPIATPADLLGQQLIHYEDSFRHRLDWPEWLRAKGVDVAGLGKPLRLTDYLVCLQAAMDGQGIVLGWRPIVDDLLASRRLVLALPEALTTERRFFVVTPKGAALRKPLSLFCDWLAEQAAVPPAALPA